MRFRLPMRRSLFFIAFFLFALVALLPLGLALRWLSLDERGFSAREAQGSVEVVRILFLDLHEEGNCFGVLAAHEVTRCPVENGEEMGHVGSARRIRSGDGPSG